MTLQSGFLISSPRRTLALGVGILLATALGAVTPAAAADPPPSRYAQVRLCDPTACYVAWRVVDSDGDGVCDADELMAGSDPYDARSLPLLKPILELAAEHRLPSFENGLGAFVAFPADIIKALGESAADPLGAFPLSGRKDTLTRLGITDALTPAGASLDLGRDGFTIGLDGIGGKEAPAGRRINGMNAGLISAGTDDPVRHVAHGGVQSYGRNWGGFGPDWVTTYRDGTEDKTSYDGDGTTTIERTNPDGSQGSTRTVQERHSKDGDTDVHESKETVTDPDGNVSSVTSTIVRENDKGTTKQVITKEFIRDKDGNVTGQKITTEVSSQNADGTLGSGSKVVEECDGEGGNCTQVSSEYQDSDDVDEHYDPEFANPTIVTQEMVDGTLRTLGSTITVVQGWTAPGMEDFPQDPKNPSTIMLVDATISELYVLVEPKRTTTAQPESRPDLPNPGSAAPLTGGGDCSGRRFC